MASFENIIQNFAQLPIQTDNLTLLPSDSEIETLAPIDEIKNNLKNHEHFLKIAHLNAVSLPKYRDEIFRVVNSTNFDVIGISETNVKKNTPKDLYQMQGYKFFNANRENRHCGGVGIFIKDIYSQNAKIINVNFKEKQPEILFMEVKINSTKILIGVIYKSPCIRYGIFNEIFEYLAHFSIKYEHAIFMGDFNINQLDVNSPAFKYFRDDIMTPLSLTQLIKTPTRITKESCTLIDLLLVNSPTNVRVTGNTCISANLDHSMIYCAYMT